MKAASLRFPLQRTPLPLGDVSDQVAVRSVIAGQQEMFEVIVRRYNAQLYRVGMAYLRNHAQTEDAMQNTYLKAFLKLNSFHGTSAFSTWLTRIMINECLMFLRSQKRVSADGHDVDSLAAEPEGGLTPALELINVKEVTGMLERGIAALPRSHRAVYILREVQELSTAETAACLNLSEANVKVSLHRAREGLKAQLLKSAEGLELFNYSAPLCDPMTERVMSAVSALATASGQRPGSGSSSHPARQSP